MKIWSDDVTNMTTGEYTSDVSLLDKDKYYLIFSKDDVMIIYHSWHISVIRAKSDELQVEYKSIYYPKGSLIGFIDFINFKKIDFSFFILIVP